MDQKPTNPKANGQVQPVINICIVCMSELQMMKMKIPGLSTLFKYCPFDECARYGLVTAVAKRYQAKPLAIPKPGDIKLHEGLDPKGAKS